MLYIALLFFGQVFERVFEDLRKAGDMPERCPYLVLHAIDKLSLDSVCFGQPTEQRVILYDQSAAFICLPQCLQEAIQVNGFG